MPVTECVNIYIFLKSAVQINQDEQSYLSCFTCVKRINILSFSFFIACEANCKTCDDADTCTACKDGYKLENEDCTGTSSF